MLKKKGCCVRQKVKISTSTNFFQLPPMTNLTFTYTVLRTVKQHTQPTSNKIRQTTKNIGKKQQKWKNPKNHPKRDNYTPQETRIAPHDRMSRSGDVAFRCRRPHLKARPRWKVTAWGRSRTRARRDVSAEWGCFFVEWQKVIFSPPR